MDQVRRESAALVHEVILEAQSGRGGGSSLRPHVANSDDLVLPGELHVVALAAQGGGLSGSDRIFIELARRWAVTTPVRVHVSEAGARMCARNALDTSLVDIWRAGKLGQTGRTIQYMGLTILGISHLLRARLAPGALVYSASDFWPDSLPCAARKLLRRTRWVAGFYMFAPPPRQGFEGQFRAGKPRIQDVFYWLSQRAVLPLVRRYADVILVTSQPDKDRLVSLRVPPERVLVVRGGVDVKLAEKAPLAGGLGYDGIFVGRLHVQKGVPQLLDIWSRVVAERPAARLGIIGDGPLHTQLATAIKQRGLSSNVKLLGFLDGVEKYGIIKHASLVLHPALYDSGGMAACEAFACGVPGIAFDLPALRTYYPRGMVKIPPFDLDDFAAAVLRLLEDDDGRLHLGREAWEYAQEWDWDKRAREIGQAISAALVSQ